MLFRPLFLLFFVNLTLSRLSRKDRTNGVLSIDHPERYDLRLDKCGDSIGQRGELFCIANEECANMKVTTPPKLFQVNLPTVVDNCTTVVLIKPFTDVLQLYNIIYKEAGEMEQLIVTDGTKELFGCKDQSTVNKEMNELIRGLTHNETTLIHSCTGFYKKEFNMEKLELSVKKKAVSEVKWVYTLPPAPEPPTTKKPRRKSTTTPPPVCQPSPCPPPPKPRWKLSNLTDKYIECNPNLIIPPMNHSIVTDLVDIIEINPMEEILDCANYLRDKTDKDNTFLFYQRMSDITPQRVNRFSCLNRIFKVELAEGGDAPNTHNQFSMFCGEYVSKKCLEKVPNLECEQCEPAMFTPKIPGHDSKLGCTSDRFSVEVEGKKRDVTGKTKCIRGKNGEPEWAIETKNEVIEITKIACQRKLSCLDMHPVISECKVYGCSEPEITEDTIICAKDQFLRYDMKKWKDEPKMKITCDHKLGTWSTEITERSIGCYKNKEALNSMKEARSKMSDKEKMRIGIIVPCIIILLISITVLIILIRLIIRTKMPTKIVVSEKVVSNDDEDDAPNEGEEEEEIMVHHTTKSSLSSRQRKSPGADPKLLRRPNEAKPLLYENLAVVGARGICQKLIHEIMQYSTYERIQMAEGIAIDLGGYVSVRDFMLLYLEMSGDEDSFAVWNPIVDCVRMVISAIKMKKKSLADTLRSSLSVNCHGFLAKHGLHTRPGDDNELAIMRRLCYIILLNNGHEGAQNCLMQMYDLEGHEIFPSMRRIVYIAAMRSDKATFEEFKKLFVKEVFKPRTDFVTFYGTAREDFVYALFSNSAHRDKMEALYHVMLTDGKFTRADIVIAYTAMVRDFDDCQVAAKYMYTEKHAALKEKVPVDTEEYKKIFELFYRFAFSSMSNENWLIKFVTGGTNFTAEEKTHLNLLSAIHNGEIYQKIYGEVMNIEHALIVNEEIQKGKEIERQKEEERLAELEKVKAKIPNKGGGIF